MRFLLLGGIGYLGGRLAGHLKEQGHYVRVSTRRPPENAPSWLKVDDVVQADPLKPATLRTAFSSIDVAVHLAAPDEIISSRSPREALQAGGDGTWNILQAASEASHPPAVIYLSTIHVYGSSASGRVTESAMPAPEHPYALGKYVGECVVQSFRRPKKIEALCVRLSNSFGAPAGMDVPRWSLVFNDLCRQAVQQKKLVLKTSGTQRRNFIPLSDAVRALEFLALERSKWPADGLMHLGSDQEWTILEAADHIARCAKDVLGYLPPVTVPPQAPPGSGTDFQFSSERLKHLGFSWKGDWQTEIKNTLTLCQDSERQNA